MTTFNKIALIAACAAIACLVGFFVCGSIASRPFLVGGDIENVTSLADFFRVMFSASTLTSLATFAPQVLSSLGFGKKVVEVAGYVINFGAIARYEQLFKQATTTPERDAIRSAAQIHITQLQESWFPKEKAS